MKCKHVVSLMRNINFDCRYHDAKILSDGYIFHYCKLFHSHNKNCKLCDCVLSCSSKRWIQLELNFDVSCTDNDI